MSNAHTSLNDLLSSDPRARAVACQRGTIRKGVTYDAEVQVYGKHYLIKAGIEDYNVAKATAQEFVNRIDEAYKKTVQEVLGQFPEAQE